MSTNKFIIWISMRNKVSLEIFTFCEDITQMYIQQISSTTITTKTDQNQEFWTNQNQQLRKTDQ